MQILTLKRGPSTIEGTPGVIEVNGIIFHTLELQWADNMPDYSSVPGDSTYECICSMNEKFNRLIYELQDVNGRTACLIHMGNTAGDTRVINPKTGQKYHSDVEGCIILGITSGVLYKQMAVLDSDVALDKFMELMNGETFDLSIVDYSVS